MRHATKRSTLLLASALLLTSTLSAQTPPETIEDALHGIATEAALIFTGSVTAVTPLDHAAEVSFHIEDGLRGVTSGGNLQVRVSNWAGGAERFHTGERALFLLHAPSPAGFTSPVHGDQGIVPLLGDALTGALDLRWIATSVHRTVAVRTESARSVFTADADAPIPFTGMAPAAVRGATETRQLAMSNVTGQDVHAIDRDLVTGMVRTWNTAASKGLAR